MGMRLVRPALVFAAAISISAFAQDPKRDPDQIGSRDVAKGLNWYSIEKEEALGKAMADQVMRSARMVTDPVVSEYVNRIGQNLARNSDSKFPLTIHVIEDESINAMSLPGGFFFVNTGLILEAATEAELAGGMAHEIAHIAARHTTRKATRQQIAQMATVPLIFMGGWVGYGTRQGGGVLTPLALLQFDRPFETEADMLGLQYLYKSGYDPNGMVDILEKIYALNASQPGRVSQIFQTHPASGERIVAAQKDIQELLQSRPQYVVTTSEFNEVQARLRTILAPRKRDAPSLYPPTLRRADPKLAKLSAAGSRPS
jgi:predicted Zn-dependent protease